jgi:hypothetical protein
MNCRVSSKKISKFRSQKKIQNPILTLTLCTQKQLLIGKIFRSMQFPKLSQLFDVLSTKAITTLKSSKKSYDGRPSKNEFENFGANSNFKHHALVF